MSIKENTYFHKIKNNEDLKKLSIKDRRLKKELIEKKLDNINLIKRERNNNNQDLQNINNPNVLCSESYISKNKNIRSSTQEIIKTHFALKNNNIDIQNKNNFKNKHIIDNKIKDKQYIISQININPNSKNYNNEWKSIFPIISNSDKEQKKIYNNKNEIILDFRRFKHENKEIFSFPKELNKATIKEEKKKSTYELLGKKTKLKNDEIDNKQTTLKYKKAKSIANCKTKPKIENHRNIYKKRENKNISKNETFKKTNEKIDKNRNEKRDTKIYLKRKISSNKQNYKANICKENIKKAQKIKELNTLIEKSNITENDIEEIIQFIIDRKKDKKRQFNEILEIDKLDNIELKNYKKNIILEIKSNERLSFSNSINQFEQKTSFIKNNKPLKINKKNEIEQKNIQDNKISKKNLVKYTDMNYKENILEENQIQNSEKIENILKNGNDEIDKNNFFNDYLNYADIINQVKAENKHKLSDDIVEDKKKGKDIENYKLLQTNDNVKESYLNNNNKEFKAGKLKEKASNQEYGKIYCFRNIGNNCYLNSSLQLLTRIKDLKNELLNIKGPLKNGSTKGQLILEFKELLNKIEKAKDNNLKLDPSNLKRVMGILDERYLEDHQEDSNEFISNFIDGLLWETGNTEKENKKLIIENNADKKPFENFYKKFYLRRGYSFLLDLFYGILKIEKKCKNCDYSLIKFNAYNMLELPIYDLAKENKNMPLKLEKILDTYISKKNNESICKICKEKEIYTKNSIYTLPKYLIISFGRSVGEKYVYNDIQYPEIMNIKSEFYNNNYYYKLECVIEHVGSSNSGHYTALCPIDKDKNIWYRFSDCSYYQCRSFHSENSIILLYKSIV